MNTEPMPNIHVVSATQVKLAELSPLNTTTLFPKGSKERTIVHDNTEYRLRITAQGKLILTK